MVCATGAVLFTANPIHALALEEGVAGAAIPIKQYCDSQQEEKGTTNVSTLSSDSNVITVFNNIGIANVTSNLNIRQTPEDNGKIVGKLPENGGCTILEADDGNGWIKIKSGKVTGYVSSLYLITGEKASKLALQVGNLIATANTNLNVRRSPSISSATIDSMIEGEELLVEEALVVTYGEQYNKWVKVKFDSDDDSDDKVGYVAKEFVNLSYELIKAVSMEELEIGAGVSSKRASMVNFAKKYLGNRYVWGGTSLDYGIDCSGFTQAIYKEAGYWISRVSRDQARGGTTIKSGNVKPGDLVFYGNNSTGYINHVAMYIGNGNIIHASNPRTGIKISKMYYRTPVKCVRYIND